MKSPQSQRPATYHGLVNNGATCYLNSVLQVLFTTEDFKERVTRKNAGKEHIDSDLCDLFNKLKEGHAHTDTIRKRLKIKNVHEQCDAAEHYEKILRLTSPAASEIFHGELVNRSTCKECNTQTESEAGFWHLLLPLIESDNNYSVERGIEDFFRPSVISGKGQMYCEKCDEKCDAVLDCEVTHHPEVLVLLLKRFEFDFSDMTYVKINCAVNVPYHLQTPQNQSYELYALVEHFGELRYGHYISKIKSQDNGRWYIFDDLNVTESEYEHFQLDPTERSKTAYLLFYRKQTSADTSLADIEKGGTLEASQTKDTDETEDAHSRSEEEVREESVDNEADVTSVSIEEQDIENKPVSSAPKRGTLSMDSKQRVDNADHPCNKKQKGVEKIDQEDGQQINSNRNVEERIASSHEPKISVESALQRHKSRESCPGPREDIRCTQQYTERSQQKGLGSEHRDRTGKTQRNQRMYDTERLTSEGNTQICKSTPKNNKDYSERNVKSQNQSRVDHSCSSFTKNDHSNRCHNTDTSIDHFCEYMKELSVAKDTNEEQKREGKKQKGSDSRESGCRGQLKSFTEVGIELETSVKKPKKRRFFGGCMPSISFKKRLK